MTLPGGDWATHARGHDTGLRGYRAHGNIDQTRSPNVDQPKTAVAADQYPGRRAIEKVQSPTSMIMWCGWRASVSVSATRKVACCPTSASLANRPASAEDRRGRLTALVDRG